MQTLSALYVRSQTMKQMRSFIQFWNIVIWVSQWFGTKTINIMILMINWISLYANNMASMNKINIKEESNKQKLYFSKQLREFSTFIKEILLIEIQKQIIFYARVMKKTGSILNQLTIQLQKSLLISSKSLKIAQVLVALDVLNNSLISNKDMMVKHVISGLQGFQQQLMSTIKYHFGLNQIYKQTQLLKIIRYNMKNIIPIYQKTQSNQCAKNQRQIELIQIKYQLILFLLVNDKKSVYKRNIQKYCFFFLMINKKMIRKKKIQYQKGCKIYIQKYSQIYLFTVLYIYISIYFYYIQKQSYINYYQYIYLSIFLTTYIFSYISTDISITLFNISSNSVEFLFVHSKVFNFIYCHSSQRIIWTQSFQSFFNQLIIYLYNYRFMDIHILFCIYLLKVYSVDQIIPQMPPPTIPVPKPKSLNPHPIKCLLQTKQI
ncbi:transmembrane protein, putative (macronuclear) [Tetrahymena thermophila SB210]|uniref:Transmembrane protein, putative n=1 Tax=Tetrahymena thermophila (strain SB210) TaxID=312017 RepID=W7X8V1_TETTS|nr:transmembrane protein, putative [Tetrahymena thermophila SB210]EWS72813.1 transmembrane protein, putative [Tetrahymena thermophila SB210]|eukprot:XP_012654639.1 transmembrane protein, putative [Tetrahymena thermophila SB210]